ncbi:hypothetical protein A2U01_0115208, partial [Trifolium medium]|nr:hypothetical protein [Trifolium medium]
MPRVAQHGTMCSGLCALRNLVGALRSFAGMASGLCALRSP